MTNAKTTLSELARLQQWYVSMCNGSWEHLFGINLQTVDNPGWWLQVDLDDSYLLSRVFSEVDRRGSREDDWVNCFVKDNKFVGYCGPNNLEQLLEIFLDWAA